MTLEIRDIDSYVGGDRDNRVPNVCLVCSIYHGSDLNRFRGFLESLGNAVKKVSFDVLIAFDGPGLNEHISMLEDFEDKAEFVNIYAVKCATNKGLANNLNLLIMKALMDGYEFIARADTDDTFDAMRLPLMIKFLTNNPEIDVAGCQARYTGIKRNVSKLPLTHLEISRRFCYGLALIHPTVIFRRSFFLKAGLYEPGRSTKIEDLLLWESGFRNGARFANVRESLYTMHLAT